MSTHAVWSFPPMQLVLHKLDVRVTSVAVHLSTPRSLIHTKYPAAEWDVSAIILLVLLNMGAQLLSFAANHVRSFSIPAEFDVEIKIKIRVEDTCKGNLWICCLKVFKLCATLHQQTRNTYRRWCLQCRHKFMSNL